MRGEKQNGDKQATRYAGSSPLARGKVVFTEGTDIPRGIIPACAGKSVIFSALAAFCQDHPRLRGEKFDDIIFARDLRGSSPLARGKGAVLCG